MVPCRHAYCGVCDVTDAGKIGYALGVTARILIRIDNANRKREAMMDIQEVFEVPENQSVRIGDEGDRDLEMMARSFYRLLRKNGYTRNQVINVAGYILDGLIHEFEAD